MARGPEGVPGSESRGEDDEPDVVVHAHIQPDPNQTPIGVTIVDDIIFTTRESLDAYLASRTEQSDAATHQGEEKE
jgi:hypothetical protein